MVDYKLSGCGFGSRCNHLKTSDIVPISSKELLDIQATIECGFTLKCVRDTIIAYRHIGFPKSSQTELRACSEAKIL